jgi:hypothetical protein
MLAPCRGWLGGLCDLYHKTFVPVWLGSSIEHAVGELLTLLAYQHLLPGYVSALPLLDPGGEEAGLDCLP